MLAQYGARTMNRQKVYDRGVGHFKARRTSVTGSRRRSGRLSTSHMEEHIREWMPWSGKTDESVWHKGWELNRRWIWTSHSAECLDVSSRKASYRKGWRSSLNDAKSELPYGVEDYVKKWHMRLFFNNGNKGVVWFTLVHLRKINNYLRSYLYRYCFKLEVGWIEKVEMFRMFVM